MTEFEREVIWWFGYGAPVTQDQHNEINRRIYATDGWFEWQSIQDLVHFVTPTEITGDVRALMDRQVDLWREMHDVARRIIEDVVNG